MKVKLELLDQSARTTKGMVLRYHLQDLLFLMRLPTSNRPRVAGERPKREKTQQVIMEHEGSLPRSKLALRPTWTLLCQALLLGTSQVLQMLRIRAHADLLHPDNQVRHMQPEPPYQRLPHEIQKTRRRSRRNVRNGKEHTALRTRDASHVGS